MQIISRKEAGINRLKSIELGLKTYHGAPCKNCGETEKYISHSSCIKCNSQWKIKNPEKAKESQAKFKKNNPNYSTESVRKWRRKNPEKSRKASRKNYYSRLEKLGLKVIWLENAIKNAKCRAKRRNINFNITKDDIPEIPDYCPYLGIELSFSGPYPDPAWPTLDRIENDKGYVKGNVIVISYKANMLKSNATLEELEQLTYGVRCAMEDQFVDYGAYI